MTHPTRRRMLAAMAAMTLAGPTPLRPLARADTPATSPARPNVLFIAVDDLRPQLGCYGVSSVKSPHIDQLASRGVVFDHAYCQQAVCSPSRTSLLTGCRPDTTRVYDLTTHFRKNLPHVVTLPQLFKQQGYDTRALGKIYHGGLDDPESWSAPLFYPSTPWYQLPESRQVVRDVTDGKVDEDTGTGEMKNAKRRGPPTECADVPDNAYFDGVIADKAVELLRAPRDKPFFLAVGFLKPHLPFVAPKKYWDLYQPDQLPGPTVNAPPSDSPAIGHTTWGELRVYHGIPASGPLTPEQARLLIHGYHACVSYTDAQVGRLLAELDRQGLRDNTIVVLWGDHGWKLGDYGMWCKHTNYELDTRSTLLVSAPGKARGKHAGGLTEFVDVYPTLCDLCGLTPPTHLEGSSFAPLLSDPDRIWKRAAFSQYPRGRTMGYSVRTSRYRFTQWREPSGRVVARELYDYETDPHGAHNIAEKPENQGLVRELAMTLRDGWRAALPPRG